MESAFGRCAVAREDLKEKVYVERFVEDGESEEYGDEIFDGVEEAMGEEDVGGDEQDGGMALR